MEIMLFYLLLHILAVNCNEHSLEMSEQGKMQYQLIKERELIPKYGQCWKLALDNLEASCRYLSEDTQSNMALHFANCFLEMSGHETYNCELNRKPNLRKICISSMTDRAFNVYIEFYTHTQNICWFLHGQMWQEIMAENTLKFSQQLRQSARQQADLINVQKSSIVLQEKMLEKGQFLEHILDDLHVSMITHKEVLTILAESVSSLQSWIIGKISWFDSIIFNTLMLLLVFLFTSTSRTISARLPLITLIFINLLTERLICFLFSERQTEVDTQKLYDAIQSSIWYLRYLITFIAIGIIIYSIVSYKDVLQQNLALLRTIEKQNEEIMRRIVRNNSILKSTTPVDSVDVISEAIGEISYKNEGKCHHCRVKSKDDERESSVESKGTSTSSARYNLRSSRRGTPVISAYKETS